MIRARSSVWSLAVSVLFVAAVLGVLIYFDTHQQVLRLLEWLDAQGAWAPLLFILVMTLVLVLPGVMFTTGAGFVFGVVEGTVYVVLGTTLGAALAFLIARYLFGARHAIYPRARQAETRQRGAYAAGAVLPLQALQLLLNRTLFLMFIDSASRAASHCPGKLNLSASSNFNQ